MHIIPQNVLAYGSDAWIIIALAVTSRWSLDADRNERCCKLEKHSGLFSSSSTAVAFAGNL